MNKKHTDMAHTFNLRTTKKHGEGTLYTMVKANGTTMRINTGIVVDIAKWNGNREAYLMEDAANNNGMSITAKMGKASNIIDAMVKQGCKDGKEIASAIQDVTDIDAQRAEAAIRETKEETGLTVSGLVEKGTLRFQFKDGMRMVCYVFSAETWEGELKECEEAKPFWTMKNNLDYDKMWKDDKMWLPLLLEGKEFEGWFVFDDREMLDAKVECISEE